MSSPEIEQIQTALTQVMDPELGRTIVELGMVREIQVVEGNVAITIALTVAGCPMRNRIQSDTEQAVMTVPGVESVQIELVTMTDEERQNVMAIMGRQAAPSNGGKPLAGQSASDLNRIGRVVAILSGKGGVGKSSVTALLATFLRRQGYRVGILDADLTGPSIPRLFGVRGPVNGTPLGIMPVKSSTGVQVMSTNLMLEDENKAIIWRGSIMTGVVRQFWTDVLWGQLDYLLLDLPPGTSDATLTVMQSIPLDGVVMVTTPQRLATMVVRKTVDLSQSMNVPVFGVVENFAFYPCPETGVEHEIFGPSHADEVAEAAGAPILARLPINPELARLGDEGKIEEYEHPAYTGLVDAFIQAIPLPAPEVKAAPVPLAP